MCATGSACGCGSTASDLGGGAAIVIAGAVAVGGVVAFLAAHLLLLALAAVALPVATLAVVRYLRRYVVLVHKQPPRRARQALVATPAIARPRPAIARPGTAQHARIAGARQARAVHDHPALAIEPGSASGLGIGQVPALDAPAAAQLSMGGYHLHFHGVSAAEVAALLRRDGEPALLRREDAAALSGAEDRARA
ncbi:MAG TPA: hypothetical protein VIK57_07210 [Streptosporangiaceae bacterium]